MTFTYDLIVTYSNNVKLSFSADTFEQFHFLLITAVTLKDVVDVSIKKVKK